MKPTEQGWVMAHACLCIASHDPTNPPRSSVRPLQVHAPAVQPVARGTTITTAIASTNADRSQSIFGSIASSTFIFRSSTPCSPTASPPRGELPSRSEATGHIYVDGREQGVERAKQSHPSMLGGGWGGPGCMDGDFDVCNARAFQGARPGG
jgi:hypothetical protein